MEKERLVLFSDAFFAIIMTIMVLELEAPARSSFSDLTKDIPIFLSYAFSFLFISIYWINHHHLFQVTKKINVKIIWANIYLLFSLSLIPFATSWVGKFDTFDKDPVILYSCVMFMSSIAYKILVTLVVKTMDKNSNLAKAFEYDRKWLRTALFNIIAIAIAFVRPKAAVIMLLVVILSWMIPDKRFEIAYYESLSEKDNN